VLTNYPGVQVPFGSIGGKIAARDHRTVHCDRRPYDGYFKSVILDQLAQDLGERLGHLAL
jgi:hypothetical protein